MTPPHLHNLIQRSKSIGSRATLWICMATLALGVSGCFAPFIPLAAQGVGMLAKAIGVGAQAGTMVKHGNDPNPEETELYNETDFSDSDFDSSSSKNLANTHKCNEVELLTPQIVEFRTDHEGVTQWRDLGLGGTASSPRWTVTAKPSGDAAAASASAKDVAPGGWAPATNLAHMNFSPPLEANSTPGHTSFLAFAPAVTMSALERDQLASLVLDFGPVVGTFQYHGRVFKYATLKELPCFPVPQ
jgi:hypothetical protein